MSLLQNRKLFPFSPPLERRTNTIVKILCVVNITIEIHPLMNKGFLVVTIVGFPWVGDGLLGKRFSSKARATFNGTSGCQQHTKIRTGIQNSKKTNSRMKTATVSLLTPAHAIVHPILCAKSFTDKLGQTLIWPAFTSFQNISSIHI